MSYNGDMASRAACPARQDVSARQTHERVARAHEGVVAVLLEGVVAVLLELTELAKPVERPCLYCSTRRSRPVRCRLRARVFDVKRARASTAPQAASNAVRRLVLGKAKAGISAFAGNSCKATRQQPGLTQGSVKPDVAQHSVCNHNGRQRVLQPQQRGVCAALACQI